ncbi:MAG: hypothetical protein NTU97_04060 [Candidatus Magasanikbacteria bacterium]|nr:hypothetical protein [Candidatus Magasanikbacteria bacterium]
MDSTQPVIRDFTPSPIEEPALKNKGSCLWKLISLLITLVILAVVVFSIISIFYSGPTIKRVAALPSHFPTDVPLYRFDDRSLIHFQDAKENDLLFNRLAQVPKYIFGPIILKFQPDLAEEKKILRNNIIVSPSLNYADFKKLLQPIPNNNLDIIEIEWDNLNDAPKKIFDFYKKNLTSQDYQITKEDKGKTEWRLNFKKDITEGELLLTLGEEKNTTPKTLLKIIFSNQIK